MMLTIVLVRLGDKVAGCYRPALWIAGQVQYDGPGWIGCWIVVGCNGL